MEDHYDILEPPRKKFKNADQPPFSAPSSAVAQIQSFPRDILSEILDWLDTQSVFFLTITCHYFKNSNLWDLISRLDTHFTPIIVLAATKVNVDKITRLEHLEVEHARRYMYLSALLRLTNLKSLQLDNRYVEREQAVTTVLSNFTLLQALTKFSSREVSTYHGAFLTKLVAIGWSAFDAKCITQFHKLQVLKLSNNIQKFMHADAITMHLTRLTSLTLNNMLEMSEGDFTALCCHTQLRHLSIGQGYNYRVKEMTNLHNLTKLECGLIPNADWTKILAPLTALQHIKIIKLAMDSFSPQLGSTLTYLAHYRSFDLNPVFCLSSLQYLDINVPKNSDTYIKLNELTRLTKLSLFFSNSFGSVSCPYWTVLTHLLCLQLAGGAKDDKLLKVTAQLMPSVQILGNK